MSSTHRNSSSGSVRRSASGVFNTSASAAPVSPVFSNATRVSTARVSVPTRVSAPTPQTGLSRSTSFASAPVSRRSGAATANYNSQVEKALREAKRPIEAKSNDQYQAGQYKGIFLNKEEVDAFRGPIPITQYKINEDKNPEVIKKRLDKVKYQQEIQIKYLKPKAGPKPGDIIVREKQSTVPPAPPVIIRQEAQAAKDQAPLVLRERPPRPPTAIPETVVEIEGKPAPPPARRVIVEKLSSLPAKPQTIIVEKWLPFEQQKRRVVYEKNKPQCEQKLRNLIIEWEAPEVEVEKVCRELCTVEADPEEYLRKYGDDLKDASELPSCDDNKCGKSQSRAATKTGQNNLPELEGDVEVLKLVDLDKYGLGAYKSSLGL